MWCNVVPCHIMTFMLWARIACETHTNTMLCHATSCYVTNGRPVSTPLSSRCVRTPLSVPPAESLLAFSTSSRAWQFFSFDCKPDQTTGQLLQFSAPKTAERKKDPSWPSQEWIIGSPGLLAAGVAAPRRDRRRVHGLRERHHNIYIYICIHIYIYIYRIICVYIYIYIYLC